MRLFHGEFSLTKVLSASCSAEQPGLAPSFEAPALLDPLHLGRTVPIYRAVRHCVNLVTASTYHGHPVPAHLQKMLYVHSLRSEKWVIRLFIRCHTLCWPSL